MRARERFSPRDWGRIPEAGAELPRRTAPPACCGAYVAHLRRKAGGFSLVVRTLSTWVSHYWSHCNPAIRINCDLDQSMPTKRKSERYWNLYISGLNSSGHRRHRLAGCNLAAQLVEKRADVREGSNASIPRCPRHGCFTPDNGHSSDGSARQKWAINTRHPYCDAQWRGTAIIAKVATHTT